jgi:hypothetical protein
VTGAVDGLPAEQSRYASLGIERLHHGGQVGPGRDLGLSLLRKPPNHGYQPTVKGNRVRRLVSGGKWELVGVHVRRLPPTLGQRRGSPGMIRMQVGQHH